MTTYKSSDYKVDWSKCTHIGSRPIAFTVAPPGYDWGWSRTEAEKVAVLGDKDQVRVISSESDYHLENQLNRYGSGLYWAIRPDQLPKYLESGELVWTPDEEVRHLRARLVTNFEPPDGRWADVLEHAFRILSPPVSCTYDLLPGGIEVVLYSKERVAEVEDAVTDLDTAAFLVKAALAAMNQEAHALHWCEV